MDDQTPLPKHITWFMPWRWFSHWTPWKRWTLFVGMLLVGYIESPIVIELVDSRWSLPPATYPLFKTIAAPLLWGIEASPAIEKFYVEQIAVADDALAALGI